MPRIEQNWQKWLEILPEIRAWTRGRWWIPAIAEDVLQGAGILYVTGSPMEGKELGYAMLKCRESARNQGFWTPGKVQEIATNPADLPDQADPSTALARLEAAEEEAAVAARWEQAEAIIKLLAPSSFAAVNSARSISMSAAARKHHLTAAQLSKITRLLGRKITGHAPIRQKRRLNLAAAAGQMSLGL
jgi:hypothetical protein